MTTTTTKNNMYDNLQLWFQLIQRFISKTAFIEDDRVYIKEAGITEVPVFDAAVVMKLMNQHPHLLEDLYAEWRVTGDDPAWSVQREFSIILFEDMLEQDAIATATQTIATPSYVEDAMASIINVLTDLGFNVMNTAGVIHEAKPELFRRTTFQ